MFCCTLLYVHSSIAIILMGKRELVALLNLSSWCLVVVGRLFLTVPQGCLRFVIVVFPDHTLILYPIELQLKKVSNSNKDNDWLLADTSASSQSLCFILSLRMDSSFITSRPDLCVERSCLVEEH